jgi:hypothetical protein
MDVTLLPPSTILSHHSHLALFPPFRAHMPQTYPQIPFTQYLTRPVTRYHTPLPPRHGSPIGNLPDDLLLEILGHLTWEELIPLRRTSKRFNDLCVHPILHQHLTFYTLPDGPIPPILKFNLLKSVKHLHFHLFPYPPHNGIRTSQPILDILEAIPPDQLMTLSLPFSAPYLHRNELAEHLKRIGGKLERLDLRGSALGGSSWVNWMGSIGSRGSGLKELDLGFTSITDLPLDSTSRLDEFHTPRPSAAPALIDPFRKLQILSLSSCTSLPASVLTRFLASLPPRLQKLDISRLDQIPFTALHSLRVNDEGKPTALREIKVIGIDHLTRVDIRRLKRYWEDQRLDCLPDECQTGIISPRPISISKWKEPITPKVVPLPTPPTTPEDDTPIREYHRYRRLCTPPLEDAGALVGINIIHSAILESEDEAGYRQFIGEVVGSSRLGLTWVGEVEAEGYIEVDM